MLVINPTDQGSLQDDQGFFRMVRSALQAARSGNSGWTYTVGGYEWFFNSAESDGTRVFLLSKIDLRVALSDML